MQDIKLIKLNPENHPNGKKALFSYSSDKYYELVISENASKENGWHIELNLRNFESVFSKSMEVEIFEPYKENLECYIAEQNGTEAGIISFGLQKWNNVLRIWDLYVSGEQKRKGVGTKLLNLAKKRASEINARAIVLETQTSNFPAIQFYRKNGFELNGFDKICYSNNDINTKDLRLEMSFLL